MVPSRERFVRDAESSTSLVGRDLEILFRGLYEDSADGVLITRPDGTIVRANPAACRLLGRTQDELRRLGRGPLVIDDARLRAFLEERATTGTARGILGYRRADGTPFDVDVVSAVIPAAGEECCYVVFREDASARLREVAEKYEERYRRLVDLSPDAIFVNRRGRVAFANPAAAALFGASDPAELIGREALTLFHPEYQDVIRGRVQATLAGEQVPRIEERIVRLDGAVRFVEVAAAPIDEPDGRAVQVSLRDVTERRLAMEQLHDSEERFRAVADNIPQLAWMTDASGWISWYNRRWYEYTGTTPAEMEGWGWTKVQHPDHLDSVLRRWREGLESGTAWEDTFPLRGKDGTFRWFLSRAMPIKDQRGAVVRWFGTNTDVTEQRATEERLREADRRKDEFLATLAHELRNPLAPIRNSILLLRSPKASDASRARALDVLDRQTTHVTRLVDELLDISRISRGKVELRCDGVDLRDVVTRAAEDCRSLLDARGLRLALTLPAAPVRATVDSTRITQAITNLLGNSAKFTPRGGAVTLALEADQGEARIRVRDTGAGLDPALAERLFQPFVQGERSLARSEGGLGLGLAVVKAIVELHGGRVSAHSEGRGRGAEFVLTLPLAATAATPGRPAAAAGATAARKRVLVVDDNRDAADTLAEIIAAAGHEVEVAYEGPSAVETARLRSFDVVFCDVGLPGFDGYEVARLLRADHGDRLRLVAVTGYAQPEDVSRAEQAGYDHHLSKPPDVDEVLAQLAAAG